MVVVNHHLLCADFALKGDGFGELCPRPMRSLSMRPTSYRK